MAPSRSGPISIPGPTSGVGGPIGFRARVTSALERRGHRVVHDFTDEPCRAVLLVGATRQLRWLGRQRRSGAVVVHRLDGINWRHRDASVLTPAAWQAEASNQLLFLTRDRFADVVVYQSRFVQDWWSQRRGPAGARETVIVNGVEVADELPSARDDGPRALVVAEGNHESDPATLATLLGVHRHLWERGLVSSTDVYGNATAAVRATLASEPGIAHKGAVERPVLREAMAAGAALLSLDRNAACPNVVLEAMSVGLPVAAFDTGAVRELVSERSGVVVPYRGNPWSQRVPENVPELAGATAQLIARRPSASVAAHDECRTRFSVEEMVDRYLEVILGR